METATILATYITVFLITTSVLFFLQEFIPASRNTKFRIIEEGGEYKVQRYLLIGGWSTIGCVFPGGIFIDTVFVSIQKAKENIAFQKQINL